MSFSAVTRELCVQAILVRKVFVLGMSDAVRYALSTGPRVRRLRRTRTRGTVDNAKYAPLPQVQQIIKLHDRAAVLLLPRLLACLNSPPNAASSCAAQVGT